MADQILLVDDDQEFREELRECLKQYRVLEASSGKEAMDIIQKPHAIDLVLLDVLMPGLSGTDVLREMRRVAPGLGIIILTANGSKDVAVDALQGHADDYIEKPFKMEHLTRTIEKVLASKRKGHAVFVGKIERVKDFLKNNGNKKVVLKDVADEVCLSPKYLSRLFKKKTGMGFNDYRLKIKIQTAQELLETTPISIRELTLQLGYKNLESFVRAFKKMTGLTPSSYRCGSKVKLYAKSKNMAHA